MYRETEEDRVNFKLMDMQISICNVDHNEEPACARLQEEAENLT
jgi:hypothetical protein